MIAARMLKKIIIINESNNFVIVGAGTTGVEVYRGLRELNKNVLFFMDNFPEKYINSNLGADVKKINNYNTDKKTVYLITVNNIFNQKIIFTQLKSLGISEKRIVICDRDVEYNYWKGLPENRYKEEVSILYKEVFGKKMNWSTPSTYNEIICYEKVFAEDNEIKARLVDKYLVRNYVENKIGKEHLVKYLGIWDQPEEIDFEKLPNSFVLKMNNGSGRNILVKDKKGIDHSRIIEQFRYWMERDYCYYGLTMHYKGIVPKIICEEYLEGLAETVYDYDVFCFNGEPKYICCLSGSHREWAKAGYYETDWTKLDGVSYGWPYDPDVTPKPEQLDIILGFSKELSQGFRHARVDWYIMPDGRILFSEITFATWGGLRKFIPDIWDKKFGELITI